MGKDKSKSEPVGGEIDWRADESQTLTRTEQNGGLEDAARQVEQAAGDMHRVEVLVSINDHRAHDKVTVSTSHPFYNGLIEQNLARVID